MSAFGDLSRFTAPKRNMPTKHPRLWFLGRKVVVHGNKHEAKAALERARIKKNNVAPEAMAC